MHIDEIINLFFLNQKENPEVRPNESLSMSELKRFLKANSLKRNKQLILTELGLDRITFGKVVLQIFDYPKLNDLNWDLLSKKFIQSSLEFELCNWLNDLEIKIEENNFLSEEIGRFESWLSQVNAKFPKIDFSMIDTHLLKNIWVDYKIANLSFSHLEVMPNVVKSYFEENLIELSALLHNLAEFYYRDMDNFNEGKTTAYGKQNERANYRIPLSHLKELQQVIENIKSINYRYMNKGLEKEHFLVLQKEISKFNISMFQESTLRLIRDARILECGVSEKQLFDLLNDFLVALGFKQAITEEDEMNYLKREGATLDTIRQMKKRLILGISK